MLFKKIADMTPEERAEFLRDSDELAAVFSQEWKETTGVTDYKEEE